MPARDGGVAPAPSRPTAAMTVAPARVGLSSRVDLAALRLTGTRTRPTAAPPTTAARPTSGAPPTTAAPTAAHAAISRVDASTQTTSREPELEGRMTSWRAAALESGDTVAAPSVSSVRSLSWSGYVAGSGPYTSVSGTFNVPDLAATSVETVAAEWVGIDGFGGTRSLIQAGVDETYDPTARTVYTQAWWEILPAPSTPIVAMTVVPGDSVTVAISQLSGSLWSIAVTDDTTRQSYTTQQTYSGPQTSADWIVEAPTSLNGTQETLGAYSPAVTFSDLRAGGSETAFTSVTMVQGGATVSVPSAMTAAGFSVSYTGPRAPAPAPTATPLPTASPAPTPAPAQSLRVYSILPGQQFILDLVGGPPHLQVQLQTSPNQVTWTGLAILTLDASGAATYAFVPAHTAYYRTYYPSLGAYGTETIEVVVAGTSGPTASPVPEATASPTSSMTPQPSASPTATPQPSASPTPPASTSTAPTIFTVTRGDTATIQETGPAHTTFVLQVSAAGTVWSTLASVSTDASGRAAYAFAPTETAYYRPVFPGAQPGTAGLGVVLPPQSAAIGLSASARAIAWSGGVTLTVRLTDTGASVAGRAVRLIASRDAVTWSTIGTLTTDATGSASMRYTPATNLWYRAVFESPGDLPAETSTPVRVVVREIAILRPTNLGAVRSVPLDALVTFTTTVRPDRPELPPARVTYTFYHYAAGRWTLVARRDGYANARGQVSATWRFSAPGAWYVRSIADPTSDNANSVWSAVERYQVNT